MNSFVAFSSLKARIWLQKTWNTAQDLSRTKNIIFLCNLQSLMWKRAAQTKI